MSDTGSVPTLEAVSDLKGPGRSRLWLGCRPDPRDWAADTGQNTGVVFSGIIPLASNEPTACLDDDNERETISVRFSGDAARVTSSYDWAHHLTSLPYLGNVPGAGSGSVDDLVTGALGPNFSETNLRTCNHLLLNPEWTDHTPNFPPTVHMGDTMFWDPASDMASYVVVSTERSAAWKGNALLASLGVFGPALLNLIGRTARAGHRLYSQAQSQPTKAAAG